MFTINLEKELQDLSIERKKEDELFLSDSPEAQEYFLHNNEDNSDMLAHFGTAIIVKNIDARIRSIVKLKEKIGDSLNRVYSSQDIKDLCIKYRLRFLPSRYFNGNIGSEVLSKMKAFEDSELFRLKIKEGKEYGPSSKDNLVSSWSIDHGKYYIVAPEESFKLSDRPKDPLLFCYAGNGMWYLVCKWGNDLSITRRVRGWLSENYIFLHLIMLIGLSIFAGIKAENIKNDIGQGIGVGILIMILSGCISGLLSGLFPVSSQKIWNSEFN